MVKNFSSVLDRGQRLIQILHDILHIFDPNRNPHHPICDPDFFRPFSPSAACVMVAGCEISVSTPPRDSASEHTRTFFSILFAFQTSRFQT